MVIKYSISKFQVYAESGRLKSITPKTLFEQHQIINRIKVSIHKALGRSRLISTDHSKSSCLSCGLGWNIGPAVGLADTIRKFGACKDIIWQVFGTTFTQNEDFCLASGGCSSASLCKGVSACLGVGCQRPSALYEGFQDLGLQTLQSKDVTFLTWMMHTGAAVSRCNQSVCCDKMNSSCDQTLLSTISFFVQECGMHDTSNLAVEYNCRLSNQGYSEQAIEMNLNPLPLEFKNGFELTMKFLIRCGFDFGGTRISDLYHQQHFVEFIKTGDIFLSLVDLIKAHGVDRLKICTKNTDVFHLVIQTISVTRVENLKNILQGLIDMGVDPFVKDRNGLIPLDLVKDFRNGLIPLDLVKDFKEHKPVPKSGKYFRIRIMRGCCRIQIQTMIETLHVAKLLALLMDFHKRLGLNSSLKCLSIDVLQKILNQGWTSYNFTGRFTL